MELSNKIKERIDIISLVLNKELTQKEAAFKLEISDRQFRRIFKKFKEDGEKSLIHKNTGQPSHNKKISDDIITEIMNEYLVNFSDYGFTHYYEEQGYKHGISFQSMINIFITNDIISPYAQHKTVRLYNEKMKNAIREKVKNIMKRNYIKTKNLLST